MENLKAKNHKFWFKGSFDENNIPFLQEVLHHHNKQTSNQDFIISNLKEFRLLHLLDLLRHFYYRKHG